MYSLLRSDIDKTKYYMYRQELGSKFNRSLSVCSMSFVYVCVQSLCTKDNFYHIRRFYVESLAKMSAMSFLWLLPIQHCLQASYVMLQK